MEIPSLRIATRMTLPLIIRLICEFFFFAMYSGALSVSSPSELCQSEIVFFETCHNVMKIPTLLIATRISLATIFNSRDK